MLRPEETLTTQANLSKNHTPLPRHIACGEKCFTTILRSSSTGTIPPLCRRVDKPAAAATLRNSSRPMLSTSFCSHAIPLRPASMRSSSTLEGGSSTASPRSCYGLLQAKQHKGRQHASTLQFTFLSSGCSSSPASDNSGRRDELDDEAAPVVPDSCAEM